MASQVAPDEVAIVFGGNVRSQRMKLGLTQEQLADRVGVYAPYISAIESGTLSCRLQRVAVFAEALEITASALLKEPKKSA